MLSDASYNDEPSKAFHNSISYIEQVLESSFIDTYYSGSTLISVLLKYNQIICANIGDSRAILAKKQKRNSENNPCSMNNGWKFVCLSKDHKPDDPEEKERILKEGGHIDHMTDLEGRSIGPLRVWPKNGSNMGLAMSRSIGDKVVKVFGVTWEPG